MDEMNLVQLLVGKLRECGCPSERIAQEFPLKGDDRRCAADVVVTGLDGKTPVAIFEVKGRMSDATVTHAVQQLERYASLVAIPVRTYVVLPSADGKNVSVASTDGVLRGESTVDDLLTSLQAGGESLPSYQTLVSGFQSKVAIANDQSRGRRMDDFKLLTRCLGLVLFVIFGVDFILDRWELDWQNVSVLALAVVVTSLPYYELISVKDVAFQRAKTDKENSTE